MWHGLCYVAGMDIKREDLKQKKRRRQIGFGLFGALALAAVIMLVARLEPAAPSVERASLWIDTVKRGELLREVRGPGTLVPTEIRWISAETSANVERILVKPGAQVEPDTVILELSNPEVMEQQLAANAALTAARADLEAKRVSLESQLLDQKANLASVEADYESARLQMDAEKELADKGIIPRIQYRRSELAANQRKVRLDIEQERIEKFRSTISSQLAADRARVEQLAGTAALRQRQVEALAVKAGISGVLQQVPVEEGQQVAPGRQLARVAKPDQLRAELRIPETQMKDVVVGQAARIDTRNGVVEGRVQRVDPAVVNGAVQVDVDLTGELPAGARPDLSVDGTIELEKLEDVLYVGRPAFGQPDSEVRLFLLDEAGDSAHRVPVQLGRASVSLIEIRRGLKPGDRIVLSDTSQWDRYDRLSLD